MVFWRPKAKGQNKIKKICLIYSSFFIFLFSIVASYYIQSLNDKSHYCFQNVFSILLLNNSNKFTLALWSFFIVHFAQKVDFRMSKVPFPHFSTDLLLLWRNFPLTQFFWVPKNSVKGGVPVLHNVFPYMQNSKS